MEFDVRQNVMNVSTDHDPCKDSLICKSQHTVSVTVKWIFLCV